MCVWVNRALMSLRKFWSFACHGFRSPSKLHCNFLTLGPDYPSDAIGDGPRREDKDRKCTDESDTSDSNLGTSDRRPPTPPKPRGMGKRKYKNLVRKHR